MTSGSEDETQVSVRVKHSSYRSGLAFGTLITSIPVNIRSWELGVTFGLVGLSLSSVVAFIAWWYSTHDAIVVDEDGCRIALTPLRNYNLRFEEIRSWRFRPASSFFNFNLRNGKTLAVWVSSDGVDALSIALIKAQVPSEPAA